MGISEKIPLPGPPGVPEGLFRGETPQNKKITLLAKFLKEYFFLLHGIIQDINADSMKSEKSGSGLFFDPLYPKNRQKRAKYKTEKKFCPWMDF